MSTPEPPQEGGPPSDEVLAGEYVLGVLSGAERRDVQTRLATDSALALRVDDWERRLAPLLTDVAPIEPPERIWMAVCRRLGWEREAAPAGLWGSLNFWRTATALAAVLAVAAWLLRPAPPPQPPVVQQASEPATKPVTPLTHDDGTPGWLASVDLMRGTVLMVPVPSAPDAQGRVPELWLIPQGGAPISLGAVSISRSHTVTVPARALTALVGGSILAITLEPSAGLPHAAPSSAVIAKGTIQSPTA